MASAEDAFERISALGKTSAVTDTSGTRQVAVGCEAVKEMLYIAAKDLVADVGNRPMLTSKSCDGTPVRTVHRSTHKLPSGKTVLAHGHQSNEFMIVNQWMRARLVDESLATRVLLHEPVQLKFGKSVNAILSVCWARWFSLRQLGHHGIAIEHYAFDRAGFTKLNRLIRQWHEEERKGWRHDIPGRTPDEADLMEWLVTTPCALHDCHNSFKWALFHWFQDKDMLRDCYVGVESLRNSMGALDRELGSWVALKLSFHEGRGEGWVLRQVQLLEALKVSAEAVDLLAHQLQLYFDAGSGRLYVTEAARDMDDLVGRIVATLLEVWRFKKWSDSRWITLGQSSRTIVAALLTGVSGLVAHILQSENETPFYLRGFKNLTAGRKHFLVLCSLVGRVPEAVMSELMEDGRVAQKYEDLWIQAAEEMRFVCTLRPHVWDSLGVVCGEDPFRLATEVVGSCHAAFHFMWRRVLEVAAGLPWCLCRGNIAENLEELRQGPMPNEPVSQKIWKLMMIDYPRSQLVQAVALLGEVNWSTLAAEQQHGTLAAVHRWHQEYSPETLVSRALMLQACRLLPHQSKEEKEMARILVKLRKAMAKNPDKAGGKQWYLAKVWELTGRKVAAGEMPPEALGRAGMMGPCRQACHPVGQACCRSAGWVHFDGAAVCSGEVEGSQGGDRRPQGIQGQAAGGVGRSCRSGAGHFIEHSGTARQVLRPLQQNHAE